MLDAKKEELEAAGDQAVTALEGTVDGDNEERGVVSVYLNNNSFLEGEATTANGTWCLRRAPPTQYRLLISFKTALRSSAAPSSAFLQTIGPRIVPRDAARFVAGLIKR